VCEQACILAGKSDPVPIRALTRFLLDYGWKHGLAEPALEHTTGQSVAVIGSGIGGLVTADTLSRRGYAVTVFDSRLKPGGRVMNGLPGFRVDKELVERRLESLKRRGIRFQMGVTFGQNVKLSELRREFDAVFLGFGLADAMPLDVPGAELRGVYQSFPYVSQNALPAGQPSVDVRGKRVAVSAAATLRWTSCASPSAAGLPPPCASIAATRPACPPTRRNTGMPGRKARNLCS
jgi:glutamate synthase (NADPH/NADH) small chain